MIHTKSLPKRYFRHTPGGFQVATTVLSAKSFVINVGVDDEYQDSGDGCVEGVHVDACDYEFVLITRARRGEDDAHHDYGCDHVA